MDAVKIFFTQLNAFFDKVFVITLQRAADHHTRILREFFIKKLRENGIYDEALAKKHHRYGKPMRAGLIGCSWRHADVYKIIIREGYQKVLVLEDDVVLNKKQVPIWPDVLNELPPDWELLYTGFARKEKAPPLAFVKKTICHLQRLLGALNDLHKIISNLYPMLIGRYVFKAGYHNCTQGYGLIRPGAEKLLAHAATNEMVRAYIVQPKLINQLYQVGTTSVSYLNH